jgi:hypothetical protein
MRLDNLVAGYYRVSQARDGIKAPPDRSDSVGLLATRFARRTRYSLAELELRPRAAKGPGVGNNEACEGLGLKPKCEGLV